MRMNIMDCGYFIRFAPGDAGLLYNRRMPSFWINVRGDARRVSPLRQLIGLLSLLPFLGAACAKVKIPNRAAIQNPVRFIFVFMFTSL
jgi:hypothetical protein